MAHLSLRRCATVVGMTQHTDRAVHRSLARGWRGWVVGSALLAAVAGWGAGPAAAGTWVPPVPVAVADRFDPPAQPWLAGHRGVDLLADAGTVVRATGAGQVGFAGPLAGRGVVVVVHGALRTTYEPVTATVSVGDAVAAGEPIGVLEPAVVHCDGRACLHWGLLRGTTYLDPLALLGPTRVRLLPFSAGGSDAAGPGGGAPPVAGGRPVVAAPGGVAAASRPAARPVTTRATVPLLAGAGVVLAGSAVGLARRRRAPPGRPSRSG
jgi:hypothetical protein